MPTAIECLTNPWSTLYVDVMLHALNSRMLAPQKIQPQSLPRFCFGDRTFSALVNAASTDMENGILSVSAVIF